MKYKVASFISIIFNPFLLGGLIIPLLSFHSTGEITEALKWTAISIAISIVPVLGLIIFMVRQKRLSGMFDNPRQQRYLIYILSSLLAGLSVIVVRAGHAPHLLQTAFLTGFVAIIIFMTINFFWKISLHTAFISASATVLTIIYGAWGAFAFLGLPAVAWSRIELNQHTPGQVLAGMFCAAAITVGIFWKAGYI